MRTISKELAETMSLEGRTVCITGAASGIAKATAKRVAQAHADLVLVDIDMKGLEKTKKMLEKETDKDIHLYEIDLEQPEDIITGIAKIHDEVGPFHAWANIAGVQMGAPTLEMTQKDWDYMLNINLRGTFFCAQQAAKHMIADKVKGVVVSTVSSTIYRPVAGLVQYSSSKGGVQVMTRVMAKELGHKGIRFLCVAPTMTRTPGLLAQEKGLTLAFGKNPFEQYPKPIPLESETDKIADPDSIAKAFLFAITDLSSIFTGSTLEADAGENVL